MQRAAKLKYLSEFTLEGARRLYESLPKSKCLASTSNYRMTDSRTFRLYYTDVVTYNDDGTVTLNTWRSRQTDEFADQYAPFGQMLNRAFPHQSTVRFDPRTKTILTKRPQVIFKWLPNQRNIDWWRAQSMTARRRLPPDIGYYPRFLKSTQASFRMRGATAVYAPLDLPGWTWAEETQCGSV